MNLSTVERGIEKIQTAIHTGINASLSSMLGQRRLVVLAKLVSITAEIYDAQ
jgi:hypothetical protein